MILIYPVYLNHIIRVAQPILFIFTSFSSFFAIEEEALVSEFSLQISRNTLQILSQRLAGELQWVLSGHLLKYISRGVCHGSRAPRNDTGLCCLAYWLHRRINNVQLLILRHCNIWNRRPVTTPVCGSKLSNSSCALRQITRIILNQINK